MTENGTPHIQLGTGPWTAGPIVLGSGNGLPPERGMFLASMAPMLHERAFLTDTAMLYVLMSHDVMYEARNI